MAQVDRPCWPFALLGAAWAAMLWRAPNLLWWPRFHAEEGKWYFSYAFEHGFADGLVYVYFRAAYLNLATNLATATASLVPLERAPLITTLFAFAIQSLPLAIILFGRSRLFATPWRKVAGCALVVFAPHLPGEVWLTTLQSQVILGVVSLLILLEDVDPMSRARRWTYRALLAFGGLSGPYSILLGPAFALAAVARRQRERLVQLGVLALSLGVQASIYLGIDRANPLRAREDHGWHVAEAAMRQISWPLFGEAGATRIAEWLPGAGGLLLTAFVLWLVAHQVDWRLRRVRAVDDTTLLGAAFLCLFTATSALSIGPPGGRYAVVPGFAILLLVLQRSSSPTRWVRVVAVALLAFALTAGTRTNLHSAYGYCDGRTPTPWLEEVASWRQAISDPGYRQRDAPPRLRFCPAVPRKPGGPRLGWTMILVPGDR
jgi:hypothetical protein